MGLNTWIGPLVNRQLIACCLTLPVSPGVALPSLQARLASLFRHRSNACYENWRRTVVTAKPELGRLGSLVLHAGMPVEAFVQTGECAALSYLNKPLANQIARAKREE